MVWDFVRECAALSGWGDIWIWIIGGLFENSVFLSCFFWEGKKEWKEGKKMSRGDEKKSTENMKGGEKW